MSVLLVLAYDTGDTDPKTAHNLVILHGDYEAAETIEDSLASFMETDEFDGMDIDGALEVVLAASGYGWEPLNGGIPACSDGYYVLEV